MGNTAKKKIQGIIERRRNNVGGMYGGLSAKDSFTGNAKAKGLSPLDLQGWAKGASLAAPFNENYLKSREDVWKLRAFFPSIKDEMFPALNNHYIEFLFSEADFKFYLDKEKQFLFINEEDNDIAYFGKLHSISALEALKRYGLATLEKAKERGRTKIKTNE